MLRVETVSRNYGAAAAPVRALHRVTFDVAAGESVGLIGESGAGKTTLTRCILGLEKPDNGRVTFDGKETFGRRGAELMDLRARLQIVYQDPFASLDPRMTAHDIVAEGMVIHRRRLGLDGPARTRRVVDLFDRVGMSRHHLYRYPHEFSGGQRQRLGIARALALSPQMLVLDEPTSALDVSVQAQVLNLLGDLQREMALTFLFISHDLAVIRQMCSRIELIRAGEIVESGPVDAVFGNPQSDYAQRLIAAIPSLDMSQSLHRRARP